MFFTPRLKDLGLLIKNDEDRCKRRQIKKNWVDFKEFNKLNNMRDFRLTYRQNDQATPGVAVDTVASN